MAVDHDGTGLYTTGLGHGDAMHVSDLDPDRPGLEVFQVHEDPRLPYGLSFRDAGTGEILWGVPADTDVGRGMAAHIDPRYKGALVWAIDPRVMKEKHTASIRVREKNSATPLRLLPILRFGGTAIFSASCLITIGKNPPASRKLINGTITAAGWSICSLLRERCLTIGRKGRLCFRPICSAIGAKMSCSAPRKAMLCEYTQRPS